MSNCLIEDRVQSTLYIRTRDLFGSQIPMTTGRFELQISCIRSSYLTHQFINFATLRQERDISPSSTTRSQFETQLKVKVSQHKSATPVVKQRIRVLPIRLTYQALWPRGLGNYFVSKRFAILILLWALEFVIQINLVHDTIAV